jgi:hypothetical protein
MSMSARARRIPGCDSYCDACWIEGVPPVSDAADRWARALASIAQQPRAAGGSDNAAEMLQRICGVPWTLSPRPVQGSAR